jgi:DNA-binding NtrC family response regulator
MRILLVEDNADHTELMCRALTEYDLTWQVDRAVSGEEALCRLAEDEAYDLVFLDYSLPGRNGLEVLEEIRRGEAPPPVVVVTGRGDERVAVEAMKGGAYDYVVKDQGYLQRLPVVARRAVEAYRLAAERKRAEEELQKSEERFRNLADLLPQTVFEMDERGNLTFVNRQGFEAFGYTKEDFAKGLNALQTIAPQDRDRAAGNILRRLT